jgi:SAM-dependent methyltransferase
MPSEAELDRVYARDYFAGGGCGYRDYFGSERAVADDKARARVSLLADCGAGPAGRWLDLGCADGRFVREAVTRGFDAFGAERSEAARAVANEESLLRGRIFGHADDAVSAGPIDVLTAWDVLEHLRSPFDVLTQSKPHLASGALVGVVVPVIDNVTARRWPSQWDQYKPPEHLWFFSRRALEHTLESKLGARIVRSQSAWRREARFTGVARSAPRWIQRIEGAMWRAAQSVRMASPSALDDSWLVIARVP